MTGIPGASEFNERWRALEADDRRELARLANSGDTAPEPERAALVAGLAQKRSRPIEIFVVFAASIAAYVLVANLILDGPEPAVLFGLAVGVAAFLLFQKRRLASALAKSLQVLEKEEGA